MQFSIAAFQQRDLLDQRFIDRFDGLKILAYQFPICLDRVDRDTHALLDFLRDVGLDGVEIFLHGERLGCSVFVGHG